MVRHPARARGPVADAHEGGGPERPRRSAVDDRLGGTPVGPLAARIGAAGRRSGR
jgi:hypothetical protein